jgi:hypothetical protein
MERHDLDVLSLFSGIVFVLVAVVGLTDVIVISATDLRWLGPLAIVAFGIVLVITSTGGRRRDTRPEDPGQGTENETQRIAQDG